MIKRGFLKNKRADSPIYPTVIFIVLNIMFFSILILFVWKSATGALIYEQLYAKEIGLIIDKAKEGMEISLDFEKAIEIAEKNEFDKKKIVEVNNEKNLVVVKLGGGGGYSFKYFSDYDISSKIVDNKLKLIVKENE